ncbi:MAG TPA: hypothetical protein VEW28_00495 [Candidatus Kapabacteria bacterium]|nr:hypothetical protein [Candidatus Kapabacteria bacterium]
MLCIVCISAILSSCGKSDSDNWIETKDVSIIAYKSDPENGKQYLDVIYENVGAKDISKLKVELITSTKGKFDTITKMIIPEMILKPKDKHLVPRPIGEPPAVFDNVAVSRVWVVYEK